MGSQSFQRKKKKMNHAECAWQKQLKQRGNP